MTYAALCFIDGERNREKSEQMTWHHRLGPARSRWKC